MLRAAVSYFVLQSLVVLQAYLAHCDDFLTVAEMRHKGIEKGLPFLWHLGMWGDVLIISSLAAVIVGKHCGQWKRRSILAAFSVAVLVSGLLHWLYISYDTPGAHVQHHQLTVAGAVHLAYMIATLTIFLLFFFYTPDASDVLVRTTAALILMHLLLGTHMVLGLINTFSVQDWYPDDPIKSVPGWITIGLVAYGLIFNILMRPRPGWFKTNTDPKDDRKLQMLTRVVESLPRNTKRSRLAVYRKFREQHCHNVSGLSEAEIEARDDLLEQTIECVEARSPRGSCLERTLEAAGTALGTVENRLRFLDAVCNLVTWLTLVKIFISNYRVADYFQDGMLRLASLERYLTDHGPATVLLVIILANYYLSRRSVKTELSIVRQLFSPSRTPHKLVGNGLVFVMVIVYTVAYLSIAWWVDDTRVVSIFCLVIFCINFGNQMLTRTNLRKYFTEPGLKPRQTEEHYEFIIRRRRVANEYCFGHPHLLKETVVVLGCAVSLVISILAHSQGSRPLGVAAVAILIVPLVGNEVVTFRWRSVRNRRLKCINDDESIADEVRVLGRSGS